MCVIHPEASSASLAVVFFLYIRQNITRSHAGIINHRLYSAYQRSNILNRSDNCLQDCECAGAPKSCGDPRNAVPLLRAYNPTVHDHFYTTDEEETEKASTVLGYNKEGTTGYIFSDQEPHSVPLYRVYNPKIIDRFYTTNLAEKNNAIEKLGYDDEGITGYVYPDTDCGALPLYRLYSASQIDHFYTMSAAERDNASNHLGYKQEGIAAYIFPN